MDRLECQSSLYEGQKSCFKGRGRVQSFDSSPLRSLGVYSYNKSTSDVMSVFSTDSTGGVCGASTSMAVQPRMIFSLKQLHCPSRKKNSASLFIPQRLNFLNVYWRESFRSYINDQLRLANITHPCNGGEFGSTFRVPILFPAYCPSSTPKVLEVRSKKLYRSMSSMKNGNQVLDSAS